MAAANYNVDYDFDAFEEHALSHANTAPKKEPAPAVRPLKKVKPKTRRQQQQESRVSFRRGVKIFVIAAVLLSVLCMQIGVGARKYEINRRITEVENEINIAKSENIRLNSVLSNYVSISEVDEYATKILGMRKLENYQIEYIDLSEEEGVIYSEEENSFWNIFG